MGLTFFNAERAKKAAMKKEVLDDVVVEPTSPELVGEVGALPQEEEVKEEEIVKPKKRKK